MLSSFTKESPKTNVLKSEFVSKERSENTEPVANSTKKLETNSVEKPEPPDNSLEKMSEAPPETTLETTPEKSPETTLESTLETTRPDPTNAPNAPVNAPVDTKSKPETLAEKITNMFKK